MNVSSPEGHARLERSAWLPIAIVSALASSVSIWNEALADAIRIPVGFFLVMRAKPDALIGLVILYLSEANFYDIGNFGDMSAGLETAARLPSLNLFGFPVNLPTMNCGFVALRVVWERINRPSTFVRKADWRLLNLWVIAIIPACVAFALSYQLRYDNWTRGMRFLLLASSYFYGLILIRNRRGNALPELTKRFAVFVCLMLTLMNFYVFWSHHGFLFIAIGVAVGFHLIVTGRQAERILGVVLVVLSVRYAISSSFTVIASVFVALVYSLFVLLRRNKIISRQFVVGVGGLTIGLSFLFSIFVVEYSNRVKIEAESYAFQKGDSWRDRILSKMFADRLSLWRPAYAQICDGPYLLVPSGRPLTAKEFGIDDWVVGAHNVTLEVLRNSGFFLGLIVLALYGLAFVRIVEVVAGERGGVLASLAAGLVGVCTAGIATGDFPADMTVGFFIWAMIGATSALDTMGPQVSGLVRVPPGRTHAVGLALAPVSARVGKKRIITRLSQPFFPSP